jgi:hypothetical protein
MTKRLVRKLVDVAVEVETQLIAHFNVTQKELDAWRRAAKNHRYCFPKSTMVPIHELWIDYEVQRDVIHDHIKNIMKKWDPRICSPVSACKLDGTNRIDAYDGQHRTIAAAILGFEEIPCAVVETNDPNFASYAFELLNDTGVKRLTPGDLHRNALVRYKNGSREEKNVKARTLQDQFDTLGIDLQDKNSRNSPNLRGNNDYFFSHFKYAYKGIDVDSSGKILYEILDAIKTVFPTQEEIDQGCFIGLYELHRFARECNLTLAPDWMKTLLASIKPTFTSSQTIHAKARTQYAHQFPGGSWSAPVAMANFLRELHIRNKGTLQLPDHGQGAHMGILANNAAPGLFPTAAVTV